MRTFLKLTLCGVIFGTLIGATIGIHDSIKKNSETIVVAKEDFFDKCMEDLKGIEDNISLCAYTTRKFCDDKICVLKVPK